jgi:5-formyltetrahydrofolate cyclo-ligase
MTSLKTLRQALRETRRAISTRCQRAHARLVTRTLRRDMPFQRARRIAAYWPTDGELDPRLLIREALGRGKAAYLPVLRRGLGDRGANRLWFARFMPGERMHPNRFGIPEPRLKGRHVRPPRHLDVLLVPLVGFDADGHRIGMGGGYYDRTLAYLHGRRHWRRPRLIGIAHECQRVDRIEQRAWDIPLDAVATERRIYAKPRPAKIR